jgi:HEAT repeat protein
MDTSLDRWLQDLEEPLRRRLRRVLDTLTPAKNPRIAKRLAPLASQDVSRLESLHTLVDSPDESTALAAIWVIGHAGDPKASVLALKHLLSSPSIERRLAAVAAIGALRSPPATSALIQTLMTDEDADVRALAAHSLGINTHEDAETALLGVLKNAAELPDVRAHAAEALGYLHSREVVGQLLAALSDNSPDVRLSAAFALGEIADPQSLPRLRELLRLRPHPAPPARAFGKWQLRRSTVSRMGSGRPL